MKSQLETIIVMLELLDCLLTPYTDDNQKQWSWARGTIKFR